MGGYISVIKKESKPYLSALKDDIEARKNPDFFWPNGTQVYCGTQGSGKTISAVKHVLDLKKRYPKSLLVSNIKLNNKSEVNFSSREALKSIIYLFRSGQYSYSDNYILFDTMDQLEMVLVDVNNGTFGVIYLIDEIHTYFNALDSKNIPMYVFTEISQQRKQRKLIIGTSQLFLRMAKPLREQCDSLIMCNTLFGVFTNQKVYEGATLDVDYNGNLVGKHKKSGWFFHNRELRNSFDTFQKVVSGAEQYEVQQKIHLVGKNNKPLKIK